MSRYETALNLIGNAENMSISNKDGTWLFYSHEGKTRKYKIRMVLDPKRGMSRYDDRPLLTIGIDIIPARRIPGYTTGVKQEKPIYRMIFGPNIVAQRDIEQLSSALNTIHS